MQNNILLCPKWVKNNRGLKKFFEQLSQYSGQDVSLVFENNIFEETIQNFKSFLEEYDCKFETISFENVTFQQYVRFDNLQCQRLAFNNVNFEKGGGIKSRGMRNGLNIDTFVFRPFQLESDFVIDLGNYANRDGFLETEEIGRIRSIEFENHKDGNGQIYFVGINEQTEEADFRNKILDKVSFQNCDLSNCYFLNAKVDKAEFRNCIFPEIKNHKYVNMLDEKWNIYFSLGIFLLITVGVISYFGNLYKMDEPYIFYFMLFLLPFYILVALFSLNAFFHPIEYLFSSLLKGDKTRALNKIENFHHHFGTQDEQILNKQLEHLKVDYQNESFIPTRKQIQSSYFSLIELYKQLKENFGKNDFQTAGNFFYAQRYMEMISVTYKKSLPESWVLNTHYFVNGFGERFIRPLVLLILILILFSLIPFKANIDYLATQNTPKYLLIEHNISGEYAILPSPIDGNQSYYPIVTFKQEDNSTQYILNGEKIDKEISVYISTLKNDWHTQFYYSVSHIILPFMSENRQWFKEVSQWAIFFGYLEGALLWLFSGAFVLALYHRIKRGET